MITSKYWIQNETGARKSLNVGESMFLDNVEGLGIENTAFSYADFRDGFAVLSANDYKKSEVIGRITFKDEAFTLYRDLADFMLSATSLFFVYKPQENYEYYKTVKLRSLTKPGRERNGVMRSTIQFDALTPWYLPTPSKATIEVTDVDVFRYPFIYGVTRYASTIAGACTADIPAKGQREGFFVFNYAGSLVNPRLTLTGDSGKVYGICDIEATIGSNERLEISTVKADRYVRKVTSEGEVVDLLEFVDVTSDPYPTVPNTENTKLELTSWAPMSGKAELTVYYYYLTV